MPKLEFTPDELKTYFSGRFESYFAADASEKAAALRIHANGEYPKTLIDAARPNEPDDVQAYRASIWKPKTKATFGKVLASLAKIRRSADWSILFPAEPFDRIPAGETLQEYTELNFPHFGSITTWLFSVLLRQYAVDPNAVILFRPEYVPGPDDPAGFVEPFPHIIGCDDVIDYVENDFAVLRNPEGSNYTTDAGVIRQGESYFIATTESIFRYDQTNDNGRFTLADEYRHATGVLPCRKIKAILVRSLGNEFLFESRLNDMVPELDEAAREYSDLQAGKVMHMFAERWEIANTDCAECNGTGKVAGMTGNVACTTCEGTGDAPNPFSKIVVRRAAANEQSTPIPPAGFIEKDVEIIKLMDQSVRDHLRDALAAINMEFLSMNPLNQSGIAKEVDKDETNNFVNAVAEDLINILDWCFFIIATWRYLAQYSADDIEAMLPTTTVPEHFDLFSSTLFEKKLISAKTNKFNPIITTYLEREFTSKEFNTSEDDVLSLLDLTILHDPMPGVDEDSKMMRLTNKGITPTDYVISSNIYAFIRRAIQENEGFEEMDYSNQRTILIGYANEVRTATSTAGRVVDNGLNDDGTPKI